MSGDVAAIRRAAATGAHLDADRLEVVVAGRGVPGSRVSVEVRYASPTDLPIVGSLIGDVHLSGSAAMRVEM